LTLIKEDLEASVVSYEIKSAEEEEKEYFSFADQLSDQEEEGKVQDDIPKTKIFKGYSKENMTEEECKEEQKVVRDFISLDFMVDTFDIKKFRRETYENFMVDTIDIKRFRRETYVNSDYVDSSEESK